MVQASAVVTIAGNHFYETPVVTIKNGGTTLTAGSSTTNYKNIAIVAAAAVGAVVLIDLIFG